MLGLTRVFSLADNNKSQAKGELMFNLSLTQQGQDQSVLNILPLASLSAVACYSLESSQPLDVKFESALMKVKIYSRNSQEFHTNRG